MTINELKKELHRTEEMVLHVALTILKDRELQESACLTPEELSQECLKRCGVTMSPQQLVANLRNIGVFRATDSKRRKMGQSVSKYETIANCTENVVRSTKQSVKVFKEVDNAGRIKKNGRTMIVSRDITTYGLHSVLTADAEIMDSDIN